MTLTKRQDHIPPPHLQSRPQPHSNPYPYTLLALTPNNSKHAALLLIYMPPSPLFPNPTSTLIHAPTITLLNFHPPRSHYPLQPHTHATPIIHIHHFPFHPSNPHTHHSHTSMPLPSHPHTHHSHTSMPLPSSIFIFTHLTHLTPQAC
ncbi:hypothetical protein Pcinc_032016 [Petrolisthes cinctipes]|uniref:Uncharacterized protein n=1 Tax=Petrolisthes cinctipes TaxID=88211 RepID=A0AAE1JZY3_PETCI|nr:hypothetical protein Pcinc_032016 [Petrolisthes cinctipes]